MDRTTLVLALCLGGSLVMLALLLVTVDLLRHAWGREARLRKAIRVAQTVIADDVARCRKCVGHGRISLPSSTIKCSACYNGREFLHMSADL